MKREEREKRENEIENRERGGGKRRKRDGGQKGEK
jgi:hypothetical protein